MTDAAPPPDEALAYLETVSMRPMLESLLESVCKDKPDRLLNYSIKWMRKSYPDAAAEALTAAEEDGTWSTRSDVDPSPDGLMQYLKEVDATTILEGIIERAIRATPKNVVAYVVDELAGLRKGESPKATPEVEEDAVHASDAVAQMSRVAARVDARAPELLEAISMGDADAVGALLKDGVPADSRDTDGLKTALMMAAEGEEACMRLLLEHGASIDYQNKRGETALMAAVQYADEGIIRLLIEDGKANVDIKDLFGKKAIDHAIEAGLAAEVLAQIEPSHQASTQKVDVPKKAKENRPRRNSVSSESIDPKTKLDLSTIPRVDKADSTVARIEIAIEKHLLFKDLDTETRRVLILSMSERNVLADERVITQGEDGDFFYIVDSGTLDCFVAPEGTASPGNLVKQYDAGTSFGELALMYNTPRAATIIANTDSNLFAIERDVFRKLILQGYMAKRSRFEKILEEIPLLKSMEKYERSVLADSFDERRFKAGDAVITEGDIGMTFYILLEGECVATQEDASKNTVEVKTYKAGDYFGELALLHNNVRAASVKANTDCACIALDKIAFERLLGPVRDILARDADNYAKHV